MLKATAPRPAIHPGYVSGQTYWAARGRLASLAVGAVDTLYGYPFYVPVAVSVSALAQRVSVAGTGSSYKAGVWRMASGRATGLPVVANNTGAATTSTGTVTLPVSGILAPGWYWFGQAHTGTLPTVAGLAGDNVENHWLVGGSTAQLTTSCVNGLTTPFAYAGDIAALDLTAAVWTAAAGATMPVLGFTVA